MSFTASLDDLVATNANGLLSAHPSWVRVRLGDVCEVQNGFPYPSAGFGKSSGFPLLRIRDIRSSQPETFFDGPVDEDFIVRHGDLVVGMDGDFNCARWQGPPALLNQRVCRLSPRDGEFSPEFLYYVLQGYLNAVNAHTSAITVKHLSSRTVEDLPLPLPPLPEQERIAGELDDYVSRLDAAQAALHRVQRNLVRYRASVLHAAVTGRLVPTEAELARAEGREYEPASALLARILGERRRRWEEAELAKMTAAGKAPKDGRWKGRYVEPVGVDAEGLGELPEGWCTVRLNAVADVQLGQQRHPSHTSAEVVYPYVRAANITWSGLQLSDIKSMGFPNPDRYRLDFGDVLLSEASGSPMEAGKPAIWRDEIPGACFQKTVLRVRAYDKQLLLPEYLRHRFLHECWSGRFAALAPGVGIVHLTAERMLAWPLPLPPLAEQHRIVTEVDRCMSVLDAVAALVAASSARLTRLRQSILRLAFEGRLVDQDPNDEPAAVLLERIRAEHAAGGGSARRKARRGAAVTQERLL